MNARVHDFAPFSLVERLADRNGEYRRGRFKCFCGREFETFVSNVRTGHTKSCGCTALDRTRSAALQRVRHGHARGGGGRPTERTPTYKSWQAMIARCTSDKHPARRYYKGRGITVCAKWLNSFDAFLADMGERPAGLTLDRIEPDGHYEPGNCRWATPTVQRANRSKSLCFVVGAGI